uniref:Uncharacterized protein n=1 Tax=Latimeria chalumnae TaxID=7897 RepID=H3BDV6_LATCH
SASSVLEDKTSTAISGLSKSTMLSTLPRTTSVPYIDIKVPSLPTFPETSPIVNESIVGSDIPTNSSLPLFSSVTPHHLIPTNTISLSQQSPTQVPLTTNTKVVSSTSITSLSAINGNSEPDIKTSTSISVTSPTFISVPFSKVRTLSQKIAKSQTTGADSSSVKSELTSSSTAAFSTAPPVQSASSTTDMAEIHSEPSSLSQSTDDATSKATGPSIPSFTAIITGLKNTVPVTAFFPSSQPNLAHNLLTLRTTVMPMNTFDSTDLSTTTPETRTYATNSVPTVFSSVTTSAIPTSAPQTTEVSSLISRTSETLNRSASTTSTSSGAPSVPYTSPLLLSSSNISQTNSTGIYTSKLISTGSDYTEDAKVSEVTKLAIELSTTMFLSTAVTTIPETIQIQTTEDINDKSPSVTNNLYAPSSQTSTVDFSTEDETTFFTSAEPSVTLMITKFHHPTQSSAISSGSDVEEFTTSANKLISTNHFSTENESSSIQPTFSSDTANTSFSSTIGTFSTPTFTVPEERTNATITEVTSIKHSSVSSNNSLPAETTLRFETTTDDDTSAFYTTESTTSETQTVTYLSTEDETRFVSSTEPRFSSITANTQVSSSLLTPVVTSIGTTSEEVYDSTNEVTTVSYTPIFSEATTELESTTHAAEHLTSEASPTHITSSSMSLSSHISTTQGLSTENEMSLGSSTQPTFSSVTIDATFSSPVSSSSLESTVTLTEAVTNVSITKITCIMCSSASSSDASPTQTTMKVETTAKITEDFSSQTSGLYTTEFTVPSSSENLTDFTVTTDIGGSSIPITKPISSTVTNLISAEKSTGYVTTETTDESVSKPISHRSTVLSTVIESSTTEVWHSDITSVASTSQSEEITEISTFQTPTTTPLLSTSLTSVHTSSTQLISTIFPTTNFTRSVITASSLVTTDETEASSESPTTAPAVPPSTVLNSTFVPMITETKLSESATSIINSLSTSTPVVLNTTIIVASKLTSAAQTPTHKTILSTFSQTTNTVAVSTSPTVTEAKNNSTLVSTTHLFNKTEATVSPIETFTPPEVTKTSTAPPLTITAALTSMTTSAKTTRLTGTTEISTTHSVTAKTTT